MARVTRVIPPGPMTERGSFHQLRADKNGERVLYCNGSNIIWRNVAALISGAEGPDDLFCYRGHAKKVTCASMDPKGNWVASGDNEGTVRVWGAKGDHTTKNDYKLWSGAVLDVNWSDDSTRIVAAGDGAQERACTFIWDTGSRTGVVGGHAKQVNSISFRSQRPFKIATGSEDFCVNFHEGPPFKMKSSNQQHTNFVNCVRFSPDGEWIMSAGSDSKVFIWDGKTGELVKELAPPAGISGSIWAGAWSPDSTKIATAGGDKKVRIWDRDAGAQLFEMAVGSGALDDMQVGICWSSADCIISACLDGRLLLWSIGEGGEPVLRKTVEGASGPLTTIGIAPGGTIAYGGTDTSVVVAGADGSMNRFKMGKGVQHVVGHSEAYAGPPEFWVFCLDDAARRLGLPSEMSAPVAIGEFAVDVCWVDAAETMLAVATGRNNLKVLSGGALATVHEGAFERRPTAMASNGTGLLAAALQTPEGVVSAGVAVSQYDVAVYSFGGPAGADAPPVKRCALSRHSSEVCALKFNPSGTLLASSDTSGKIMIWGMEGEAPWALEEGGPQPQVLIQDWTFHTARVTCLAWLPDGRRLVSGSLDMKLIVWNADKPREKLEIVGAHKGGVTGVTALGAGAIASVGHDGFMLVHEVP